MVLCKFSSYWWTSYLYNSVSLSLLQGDRHTISPMEMWWQKRFHLIAILVKFCTINNHNLLCNSMLLSGKLKLSSRENKYNYHTQVLPVTVVLIGYVVSIASFILRWMYVLGECVYILCFPKSRNCILIMNYYVKIYTYRVI